MAAEATQLTVDLAILANVLKPEAHTPGDRIARTAQNVGADVGHSAAYEYDSALTPPADDVTTPNARAVLRRKFTIPVGLTYQLDLTDAPIEAAQDGNDDPALTEDLTGYKLLCFAFKTDDNSGAITVKPAAANGYDLVGASSQIILETTDTYFRFCEGDTLDDVGASDRYIDFDGTEGDEIEVLMVFSE